MEDHLISSDHIAQMILFIRGQKVILDVDLARIYGVKTKRLNEQVKRNNKRFPEDFMFRLNDKELEEVVANCDHLKRLKYSSINPYAFTEHGALMVSSVLNTPSAIETSIFIVRAFIRMRAVLASHAIMERRITALEKRYNRNFNIVFEALKQLAQQKTAPKKTDWV